MYSRAGHGEAGIQAAIKAQIAKWRKNPEMYGFVGEFVDEAHLGAADRYVRNLIKDYEDRGRKSYSSQGKPVETGGTVTNLGSLD